MGRPTPRRSSLAGSSPVAPPAPQQAKQPAIAAQRSTGESTAAKKESPEGATKYPHKVSIYQAPEDTARVRAAVLHTMATEGPRTLSQFINQAVMTEVVRMEAKYNGGHPFSPVGARELPQGRPMGE